MFIENKEYEPFALEFKRCYKELMKRINISVAVFLECPVF